MPSGIKGITCRVFLCGRKVTLYEKKSSLDGKMDC